MIDQSFIKSPPQLVDGAADVLASLSSSGLKIGLISNTGLTSPATYGKWFSTINMLSSFDYIAFSNGLAVAKPSRKIFNATLSQLGVEPARALHIGDNMHTDVAGAAAAGMSTGIDSPVNTSYDPDYTIDSMVELLPAVDRWLATLDG